MFAEWKSFVNFAQKFTSCAIIPDRGQGHACVALLVRMPLIHTEHYGDEDKRQVH